MTGIGEEYIPLDSITFNISGTEARAQGIRQYTSPSPFTAKYVNGVYSALSGSTTFGVTTLGFGGTFGGSLFASVTYHGTHWWYFVSDSGPVAISSVPEPAAALLLITGVVMVRRAKMMRKKGIRGQTTFY